MDNVPRIERNHESLHESSFHDDLMINEPPTLEDAMRRATRFIGVEEERAAMAKMNAPPKAPVSKEKPRDTYYKPHHHYDKERDDKGKKSTAYYVGNTQSQQPYGTNIIGMTKPRVRNRIASTITSPVIQHPNANTCKIVSWRNSEKET